MMEVLYETLKNRDFVEKYYDDIRNAKNRSIELIKEKMLTKESIQKYKDEELSKKYGVDVYILDNDPFFILVKSLGINKDSALEKYNIRYTVDGASYSLDSSNKLDTFHNPREYYVIAYTDFERDQIVHIYPVDSFSNYDRDTNQAATNRVFELHTPESLCKEYKDYNEIVISQKNDKKNNELNNNLKVPEMFALYCYDTITNSDIMSAYNLNLGIILVKTKDYKNQTTTTQKRMHDTMGWDKDYKKEITYLDKFTQDDKFNRRK